MHRALVTDVDPRVVTLRVEGMGDSASDPAKRVQWVDLLSARGRRLMHVEVFERPDAQWYAGVWWACY